jgi:hypothetical protein
MSEEMKKAYFGLRNMYTREIIASIETDPDVINPDRGIIDPKTLTFRSIANGGNWTLEPLPDFVEQTLLRLRHFYNLIVKKPAASIGTYLGRADGLINACEMLYGDVEFTIATTKEDFNALINPKVGGHECKKVKYKVMDEILKRMNVEVSDEWAMDVVAGDDD